MAADIRQLGPTDVAAAGDVLFHAFVDECAARGFPPPWPSPDDAALLVAGYREAEPEGALGAWVDGALAGVGFVRRRGDVATIGPLAARPQRRGVGSKLLDELIGVADGWECRTVRLFQDAWNPDSFALYAGRSFSVVDVVSCIERPKMAPPRLDSARGLEMAAPKATDLAEIAALDLRFTGLARPGDLDGKVKLVARRRGAVVGFLCAQGGLLGPALAVDVADLGALVQRALVDVTGAASARLSTAAPTAMLAALALGFRVVSVGLVMSRGPAHPARPPQLYSLHPEVL